MGVPDPVIGEIASAIHVRHIQTPIDAAKVFTRASRVADVAAHMACHKYDVTPIFADDAELAGSETGDPDGTLRKEDLERLEPTGQIRSVVRPLIGSALIDSNASLIELLGRFRDGHRFMLVVGGQGLKGIVTPSDMNKQAGRTHLFMQISALEIALSDLVRAADPTDHELMNVLPQPRARQVRSRWARNQSRDEAADLVAALDFADLLQIERASAAIEVLSGLSDQEIGKLGDFRNRVMHAVLEPSGDDDDRLERLLADTALVARVLGALNEAA